MNKVRAMSYTTALQKTLRSHIKVQHDGLRYNCDLCSFSSTGQSSLRLHIRTKHVGVQYKCDSCGMTFAPKGNLRLHRKVVHEGKKINCDLCVSKQPKGQELNRQENRPWKNPLQMWPMWVWNQSKEIPTSAHKKGPRRASFSVQPMQIFKQGPANAEAPY